jgi:hypothetical protein
MSDGGNGKCESVCRGEMVKETKTIDDECFYSLSS